MKYYLNVLRYNYANFSGRARRSEYWYYFLFNMIIIAALAFLGFEADEMFIVLGLYILAIIVPSLAVVVRRLHDQDKSGWYYCVRFIPFVGQLWLLVLLCTEGTYGPNTYGADPRNPYDEFDDIGKENF